MGKQGQWQRQTRRNHIPAKVSAALLARSARQAISDAVSEQLEPLWERFGQQQGSLDLLIEIITQLPKQPLPPPPQLPGPPPGPAPSYAYVQPMPGQRVVVECSNLQPRPHQQHQQVQLERSRQAGRTMGQVHAQGKPAQATAVAGARTTAAAGTSRQPSQQAKPAA
jgi:hypothetical protein